MKQLSLLNFRLKKKQPKLPKKFKTLNIPKALTKSLPQWSDLVTDTYFGAKLQQQRLMTKWAKRGYELFDWGTGIWRLRRIARGQAERKGFEPYDIHAINLANYTLWFGKKRKRRRK